MVTKYDDDLCFKLSGNEIGVFDYLFHDGGETYTYKELQAEFENYGVDVSNFRKLLDTYIDDGWITDCGTGVYTR